MRILIINPFGIGDVLFTTPVIRAIKEKFPHSFIGYWCNERVAEVLKRNNHIDKCFALSRGDLKKVFKKSFFNGITVFFDLLSSIRKEKFDIAFDFSLDHRYGLISMLAGIKRRIGFNYKGRGRFLTHRIDLKGYDEKHIVEYYCQLLKFISIETKGKKLELNIPKESLDRARDLLESYGIKSSDLLIAIAPGGGRSWGKDAYRKHLPEDKYAQIADAVIKSLGAKVIILGDSNDVRAAAVIEKKVKQGIANICGKTCLEDFIALLGCSDILVTNDGGPLHAAVALGKKTVSFFGPVDPLVYGPYPADLSRHIVVKKEVSCSPCYHNFKLGQCSNQMICLKGISIEEAVRAISNLAF